MSPVTYVQEAARNGAINSAAKYGGQFRLPKKAEDLFKMGYDLELDTSPEIDPDAVSHYVIVIVILRCIIKLRKIDIIMKVLFLSSHSALPREGYLFAAVYVMAHVGHRYNSRLVYDLLYQEIDPNIFKNCDGSVFYWDAKEATSMNATEPCGRIQTSACSWIVIMHEIKYLTDPRVIS